jgi:hypothetical protein
MSMSTNIENAFIAVAGAIKDAKAWVTSQLVNYALTSDVNAQFDALTPAAIGAQPAGAYALAADMNSVGDRVTTIEGKEGAAGGLATLDGGTKVPVAQIPGGTAGKAVLASTTTDAARRAADIYSLAFGASVAGLPAGSIIVQARS